MTGNSSASERHLTAIWKREFECKVSVSRPLVGQVGTWTMDSDLTCSTFMNDIHKHLMFFGHLTILNAMIACQTYLSFYKIVCVCKFVPMICLPFAHSLALSPFPLHIRLVCSEQHRARCCISTTFLPIYTWTIAVAAGHRRRLCRNHCHRWYCTCVMCMNLSLFQHLQLAIWTRWYCASACLFASI